MELQRLGKLSLKNSSGTVASIRFDFIDPKGNKGQSSKSSHIDWPNSLTVDPGDLGVPDGSTITLVAVIQAAKDHAADNSFQYEKGNHVTGNYKLEGNLIRGLSLTFYWAEWQNWSQNIIYKLPQDVETYLVPTNRQELGEIISAAAGQAGQPLVRVSGQRHSQPALVTADNRSASEATADSRVPLLIDLSCYADLGPAGDQRIYMPDPDSNLVQVNAGVREDELDKFLSERKKIMKTVTAGGFFSLGGMTAVDVHGATLDQPIFSETVCQFSIMGPDGQVTSIDSTTPGADGYDAIQFARVSLGSLGVVTSVTLEVMDRPEPNTLVGEKQKFYLNFADKNAFVAKYTQILKPLLAKQGRIESFFKPYPKHGILDSAYHNFLTLEWTLDPSPSEPGAYPNAIVPNACVLADEEIYGAPYEGAVEEALAQGIALKAQQSGRPEGLLGPKHVMGLAFGEIERLFDKASKDKSDLWLSAAARVIFMSYFIELPKLDAAGLGKAWEGLNVVYNRLQTNSSFMLAGPMEFRFIRGGNSALAGTYTTNAGSTFINLDLIGFTDPTEAGDYPADLLQFFANVERQWVALGGMPHNGKMYGFYDPNDPDANSHTEPFNANFIQMIADGRADRVAAFGQFRQQRDPHGLFLNQYVSDILNKGGVIA